MADSAQKATKALIRDLQSQGYVVEKNRRGHWRVTHPTIPGMVHMPSTPSEYRSVKNTIGYLRRHLGYSPSGGRR